MIDEKPTPAPSQASLFGPVMTIQQEHRRSCAYIGREGLQYDSIIMASRFDPVGVLPRGRARLVHGHGSTSAGRVSTKGPLEGLLSAGGLPSQRCVFSLQGVQLRRTKHLSGPPELGDDLLTRAQPDINNRAQRRLWERSDSCMSSSL